jgi:NAD(P)-dependent dehydrogenase (short-subunit alcohol dehydrogenase family)
MLGTMTKERWTVDRIPDQAGRTFVVTGANSGLGLAMTRQLARRGATVILAVRNLDKGRRAVQELHAAQPDAHLDLRQVDLADLDSVRAFADGIHDDGVGVDVVVNNAGVMMPPRSLSPQGHESQFAANHLGHFALTGRLLDLLRAGRDARVVTVSSTMHKRGSIQFDDLTGAKRYSPTAFYAQSKFANVLFGLELDRRLRAAGLAIRSVLAHPGYSATNLQSSGPTGLMSALMKISNPIFAQNVEIGVLNQLYAATDSAAQGGQFIGPDGMGESRGYPTVVQPIAAATDAALAGRLWELSEKLTGVGFDLTAHA